MCSSSRRQKMGATPAKAMITEASTNSGAGNCLPPGEVIFGQTEVMSLVRRKVEKSVAAGGPVPVEGTEGWGQRGISRDVHAILPRPNAKFSKGKCAGL